MTGIHATDIEKFIIQANVSIRQAIKQLDAAGHGFITIYEKKKIAGIITDGDTRRAILKGIELNNPVRDIMNPDFIFLEENAKNEEIEKIFLTTKAKHIPVVKDGHLINVIFEEEYFKTKNILPIGTAKLICRL